MTPLYYSEVNYPGVGRMESYCRSEKMLSVRQAAVRLGVSHHTVYRMVADGLLAANRPGSGGGRISIPTEEIDDYLERLQNPVRLSA